MSVRQAKDFLVQQTAEQAALEGVPLSDLEKRMMYFTENGEMPENPIKLNDEFEAEYDSDEYEARISMLLRHAYGRIKKENPEAARQWNEAIRELRKGDHYLLVLCGQSSSGERPPHDFLKLLGAGLLVSVLGVSVFLAADLIADHYGIHWKSGPGTHTIMPVWLQRLLIGLMVGGYVYFVVLPWILKKPPIGIVQLLAKLLRTRKQS
jgi:hypothetical protein